MCYVNPYPRPSRCWAGHSLTRGYLYEWPNSTNGYGTQLRIRLDPLPSIVLHSSSSSMASSFSLFCLALFFNPLEMTDDDLSALTAFGCPAFSLPGNHLRTIPIRTARATDLLTIGLQTFWLGRTVGAQSVLASDLQHSHSTFTTAV